MKRSTKRAILVALALATLVSFAPILGMLASGAIAGVLGCPLDEGGRHACDLGGIDIGGALHVGFVSAWFTFVTWPGMLACLAAWAFLFVRWLVRRLARRFRHA